MRNFAIDNRGNEKLHNLHVENALETLRVINNAICELDSHSRVTSSIVAGTLRKERARLVAEDAAYFEAAAIHHVGADWLEDAAKELSRMSSS